MNRDYKDREVDGGLAFAYFCSPFPDLMVGPTYFDRAHAQEREEQRSPRRGLGETIGDLVRRLLRNEGKHKLTRQPHAESI